MEAEALSFLPLSQTPTPPLEIHSWLLYQVNNLSKHDFATLLMIMWSIWCNRNACVWENSSKPVSEFVPLTLAYWNDYKNVYTVRTIHINIYI